MLVTAGTGRRLFGLTAGWQETLPIKKQQGTGETHALETIAFAKKKSALEGLVLH